MNCIEQLTDYQEYIGYIAATLGSISFLPQVIKIWKSRSAKDISAIMYITYVISVILWLVYAIMIYSTPLIISEIVTLVLSSLILVIKYLWK